MKPLTKPTWWDIIDGEGDYLTKMTEVVRCVRTEKVLPLLEADNIVNNVFVMGCAQSLRDLPFDNSDVEKLKSDFRASLSGLMQIIFDVHVKPENAFLAWFTGFNHLSVPKNETKKDKQ